MCGMRAGSWGVQGGGKRAAGGREGVYSEGLPTWPEQLRRGVMLTREQEQRAQTVVGERTSPGEGWTTSGYRRRDVVSERVRGASERGGRARLLEEPKLARGGS